MNYEFPNIRKNSKNAPRKKVSSPLAFFASTIRFAIVFRVISSI